MARTCNHPGCAAGALARGLCNVHYRAALRSNPKLRSIIQTRQTVMDALPATQKEIIDSTGVCAQTVKRVMDYLRENDLAHIGSYNPPITFGDKFSPVFALGPGEDATLTPRMRREHCAKVWREGYHRRKRIDKMQSLPKDSGWAAALLMAV